MKGQGVREVSRRVASRAWQQGRRVLGGYAGELGAASLAVLWFLHLGFGRTLNPTRVSWMLREDWSTYYWGFAFFRNADWSFPLGAIPDLLYPHGSSVGFMDANPWLSVLFRIFSPVLPQDFQFAGLWFLLCYVLQAVLGARITGLATADPVRKMLGGALFALSPMLPVRSVHIALCAMFFVTYALYLGLKVDADRGASRRRIAVSWLMLAWAAGTHGYLSAMLLALTLAAYLQMYWSDRRLTVLECALAMTSAVAITLLVYVLFGYLGWKKTDLVADGFGDFSADILAPLSSQGKSRWVEPMPFSARQEEGFAYLGIGVIALLALQLVSSLASWRTTAARLRRLLPLLAVVAVLALYALSSRITWRGRVVYSLHDFYAPLQQLTGIFRSSGRFVWPLHFLLVTAAVAVAARCPRAWLGRLVLLAAVLAQAAELKPDGIHFEAVNIRAPRHPAWSESRADYRHLELVPLQLLWVCRYDRRHVDRVAWLAYRNRLTFNSGNYMRKERGLERECDRHLPSDQPLDPATIYVVDDDYLKDFTARQAVCGGIDGLRVCVDGARPTALSRALQAHPLDAR